MKPYGIKRNHNVSDDFRKNAEARRRTTQSKLNRLGRRIGRHRSKNEVRLILKGVQ